jgi:predicted MPP superfamily phosphohydrolase
LNLTKKIGNIDLSGEEKMNRIFFLIIFLIIVTAIYFSMHYVVYKFLAKHLPISPIIRMVLKLFFIFSGSSFFISILVKRIWGVHLLNYYANVWLGIMSIAFFLIGIAWILMKLTGFRSMAVTITVLSVTGVLCLISLYNGVRPPVVKKLVIPLKNLPPELNGFSIVQISDIHMEAYKSKKTIGEIIQRINNLKPDLVAITGDLVDENVCYDEEFCYQLKSLRAKYGTVAVTGNHEFFSGIESVEKMAKGTGMRLLRNQKIVIANQLQIVGLEDDTARQYSLKGPQLESILAQCDPSKPIILLYHRPAKFDQAVKLGVGLQLSGHTHAGQIPPMDLIVMLIYKYPVGLYSKDDAYIYTNPGTGYWGPPMRLFSRSEITYITLVPPETTQFSPPQ